MTAMTAISELRAEPIAAIWRPFAIAPESVKVAREFTTWFLAEEVRLGGEHAADVVLVVSELVTNAIRYGGNGRKNISLELGIWSKWTLITVDDRDPTVHEPAPASTGDDLRESGRGLQIVEALAARWWWTPRQISKTCNAVVLRTGVTLTDEDHSLLDCLEADR